MDFSLISEHPYTTGGVVLGGGLLLFLYWRSGSSSTQAGVPATSLTSYAPAQASPAVQIAALQAGAGLQAAQIDATNKINNYNFQVDALRIASATDLAKTTGNNQAAITAADIARSGTIELARINANAGVTNNTAAIQGQVDVATLAAQVGVAQLSAQQNIAQIGANTTVAVNQQNSDVLRTQITKQNESYKAQVQAATDAQKSNNLAAVLVAGQNADLQRYIVDSNNATQIANVNTAAGVSVANTRTAADVAISTNNSKVDAYRIATDAATQQALAEQHSIDFGTSVEDSYLHGLIQLKAYGKDITGLPQTLNQPKQSNGWDALTSVASSAGKAVAGIAGLFL